jgi:tetratricopeptide (TPR) repeat protein
VTLRLESIGIIAIILTIIIITPMKNTSSTLTSADVRQVLESARDAELCRNLDLFQEILSVFWEDIKTEPELSSFDSTLQPELLRLCGVFLSQLGRARGFPDYQIRAKDLLARAARLFEAEDFPDKAAEAKVGLANCFWFSGEISEYDDILRSIEIEFGAKPNHPVLIQITLNRIFVSIWRQEFEETMRLIKEVADVISSDHDFRLRAQFHNLAGIAYRLIGDVDQSVRHAKESINIARAANNSMIAALSLNNLANTYRTGGELTRAHTTSDEAIEITEARGDKGWTAHFLDTKALIYLDQWEYGESLRVIERSIEIFSEGEDYGGLTDAMWTKCLCLLRLDRFTDALKIFIELGDIAARQIGEIAVDKFTALFLEEVYPLKRFPLTDEIAALKRSLVVKAMRESGGHVTKAARKLGLRSQQHLSDILNNQFPDIYDELGIKRRARRSKQPAKKEPPVGLARLIMPKNRTYSFNFAWRGTQEPQFFHFPRDLMREFGLKTAAIVAVMAVESESLFDGGVVLYSYKDTFRIGRLCFDQFTELFLVDMEEPTFLSDVQLIGVPIGCCPASDRNKRTMKFERLRLVKK